MNTRVIWKWKLGLPLQDRVRLMMPAGAKVLSVQVQEKDVMLWALVDPGAEPEERFFRVAGTGHPIGDEIGDFIGTFQLYEGKIVFHVFEARLASL